MCNKYVQRHHRNKSETRLKYKNIKMFVLYISTFYSKKKRVSLK